MKLSIAITAALIGTFSTCADAYDINNWPIKFTANGYEFGIKGLYQADNNEFTNDRLANGQNKFEDLHTWRRKEFNIYLLRKDKFEATFGYDFQSKLWIDNYLKLYTKLGDFRLGQMKTQVGWEEASSSAATTFLERALPVQAVNEGRRVGVDWSYGKVPNWQLNLAVLGYQDMNGDNDGTTIAGKVAFNPIKTEQTIMHLGLAVARENREDDTARVRARPEANLTPVRLIDSGNLKNTDHIDRLGLEGAYIHGPWLVQSEWLNVDANRTSGFESYNASGFYIFGSWVLTGESRPYKNGYIGNIKPKNPWGAFEVAARYSQLNLNDGSIMGGKEHDWTLGVNWYLTQHFKFQANYIRAYSDKGNLSLDPQIFELRAQMYF